MLTEDARCFCLIIPTYDGTPFVRRLLDFLRAENYQGQVVLSDNSSGAHREFVEACPKRFPELWIEVHSYEAGIGFLDKLARTMERLEARHVMLCGQDDYLVPASVEKLLHLIEADPGLVCARGRVARFLLRPIEQQGVPYAAKIHLNKHPMLPYEDPEPVQRVLAHMRAYTSTLYSLHRRAQLLECFRATHAATRNVMFWQYLSSCITVALGRVACLDELFLARQIHERSWSATLQGYEQWPLLVTSPDYSAHYMDFRGGLIAFLTGRLGCAGDGSLGAEIDAAFIGLVQRSFCSLSHSDAANNAFFARLQTAGTVEHQFMDHVTRFTLPYRDTY